MLRKPPLPLVGAFIARTMGRLLSPGKKHARLVILTYHRVLTSPDPLRDDECDAEDFTWQMHLLAKHFTVLGLSEAIEALRGGRLPPRAVCVTFDDGYLDNVENALPILLENGLRATFFISTGFLEDGCMWNDVVIEVVRQASGPVLDLRDCGLGRHSLVTLEDRCRAIQSLLGTIKYLDPVERLRLVEQIRACTGAEQPRGIMTRPEDVRRLARAGMEVGGHTVTHPILARMDDAGARAEIAGGKQALEKILGRPVRLFAYPNGIPHMDYRRRHVEMVRELGFDAAVTTSCGAVTAGSDFFQLPRFAPWDREPMRFMLRLCRNYARAGEVV